MEHLKDTEKFIVYKKKLDVSDAARNKDLIDVEENLSLYISKLVSWIERFIFNRISKRVNWLLDRIKNDAHEIVKDGNKIGEEGNWRDIISGDNLLKQRHDGSDWVTIETSYGS